MTSTEIIEGYKTLDPAYAANLEEAKAIFETEQEFDAVLATCEKNDKRILVVGDKRNAVVIINKFDINT